MQYQEAVAEARRLISRSEADQWRLAWITWQQVEGGASRRQWARDIGVDPEHVSRLYRVWQSHGDDVVGTRPRFTDAYAEARAGIASAPTESERVQQAAKVTVRNMPPEQKAEVVREALDDQDVAVRVLRDPHTRRNVTDAREQVVHEIESTARERVDADPQSRAIREASLTLNIEAAISKARFWVAEATRLLQDLEDRDSTVMERFTRDVDEVDLALGWLRTALEGGRVSDEDLARLLEGGA